MFHYLINISYDGTSYKGWQKQSENDNTIQTIIESAISRLTTESVSIRGSGRTDAGVSAYNQYADFFTTNKIDFSSFISNINKKLPDAVRIKSIRSVPDNFHSRKSAISKTYLYYVSLKKKSDVFYRNHFFNPADANFNFKYKNNRLILDLDAMQTASKFLIGEHDFSAFTTDKSTKSHIRTVTAISIKIDYTASKVPFLIMSFTGNGFLYNMVRILAGTILYAGSKKILPSDIPVILDSKKREAAGPTLPSNGLFLKDVIYNLSNSVK